VRDEMTGDEISYARLAATARAAGAGLIRRGLLPGDPTGVYAADILSGAVLVTGVWAAGGMVAPVPLGARLPAVSCWLAEEDIRLLLAGGRLAHSAVRAAERSRVREVVVLGAAPPGTTAFDDIVAGGQGMAIEDRALDGDWPALLPFGGAPISAMTLMKSALELPPPEPAGARGSAGGEVVFAVSARDEWAAVTVRVLAAFVRGLTVSVTTPLS
jgi:hypothetical protein